MELADAAAVAYLEALADALEDGRIIGDEAKKLARIAGTNGMGAAEIAALNERFLETMRKAAFADDVLTTHELRELTRASRTLGFPDYFDDLIPTTATAPTRPAAGATTTATRRCGHCRTPGHNRTTCPELN